MSELCCTIFRIAGDKDNLKQLAEALDKYDSIEEVAKALNVELDSDTCDTSLTTIHDVEAEKEFLSFVIDDTDGIPYEPLDEICDELGGNLKAYYQEDPVQIPSGRVQFDGLIMSRPNNDAGWFTEKYGLYYEVDDSEDSCAVFETLKDVYEFIIKDLRRKGDEDSIDAIDAIEQAWEELEEAHEADNEDTPEFYDDFISEADNWGYQIAEYDQQDD